MIDTWTSTFLETCAANVQHAWQIIQHKTQTHTHTYLSRFIVREAIKETGTWQFEPCTRVLAEQNKPEKQNANSTAAYHWIKSKNIKQQVFFTILLILQR